MEDGRPDILTLLHIISCAASLEEAQIAFALLAGKDLKAAHGLAVTLECAIPETAPVWAAILDHAKEMNPLLDRIKPFDYSDSDAADTANELADRMGWQDMEPR